MNQIQTVGKVVADFGISAKNEIEDKGKKGIEVANFLVTGTDPLHKTIKVASATFVLIATILGNFIPGSESAVQLLMNVNRAPNAAKKVIGATNVLQRFFEFTDPQARKGITKTWQKTASRVTLTVGQALETISFIGNVASLNLGILSAKIIGNLPIINLVQGAFIVTSSGFSIWDCANTLKVVERDRWVAKTKLENWKEIDEIGIITRYNGKITADKPNLSKSENYLSYIASTECSENLRNYKISKYEAKFNNSEKLAKKCWLSIVADIAKIAIIAIGTIALAFVLTASAFVLATAALALIASSLGLAKTLYAEFGPKPERIPTLELNVALT